MLSGAGEADAMAGGQAPKAVVFAILYHVLWQSMTAILMGSCKCIICSRLTPNKPIAHFVQLLGFYLEMPQTML